MDQPDIRGLVTAVNDPPRGCLDSTERASRQSLPESVRLKGQHKDSPGSPFVRFPHPFRFRDGPRSPCSSFDARCLGAGSWISAKGHGRSSPQCVVSNRFRSNLCLPQPDPVDVTAGARLRFGLPSSGRGFRFGFGCCLAGGGVVSGCDAIRFCCWPIAQMKPASSRATATTATCEFFFLSCNRCRNFDCNRRIA